MFILLYFLHSVIPINADEEVNPLKSVFAVTTTSAPILFSRNDCDDIADGLAGTRGVEDKSANLVKLNASTTLPQSPGTPKCVVNWVYLDNFRASSRTMVYDVFQTSETTRTFVDSIWTNNHTTLSKNQQLAVVACDMGASENDPIPDIPLETNFDFIIRDSNKLRLDVVQCYAGFCLLRITSNTCLLPFISKLTGALPASMNNYLQSLQTKISMGSVGVEQVLMTIENFVPPEITNIENAVIKGLPTNKLMQSITTVCINTENLPCTQEEATHYGSGIMRMMKIISPFGEEFVKFVSVTKKAGSDNIFLVNYNIYEYKFSDEETLSAYRNEFRTCPKNTMSTGDNRFFYENSVVFEIACISCPINTYYSESSVAPTVTQTTQDMYILDPYNGLNSDREYHTYFTISNKTSMSSWQSLYLESVINIGTTLRLHIPDNKLATQLIGAVECEGLPVLHTRISSSLISIEMTMQYSGKLIMVYIKDTSLQTGPQYFTTPVYILPRHSEITGTCLKCPPGTFTGSYGSAGISECREIAQRTTARRRLLSTDETQLTTTEAATYVEIGGQVTVILGIQNDNLNPSSDFSINVILKQTSLKFVQDNIEVFVKKILETYNVENRAVQHDVTFVRLHASNVGVIVGIRGNYDSKSEFSLFGLGFAYSILILGGAGVFIVIVISIIIAVVANKHHKRKLAETPHENTKEAAYCMLCQADQRDIALGAP